MRKSVTACVKVACVEGLSRMLNKVSAFPVSSPPKKDAIKTKPNCKQQNVNNNCCGSDSQHQEGRHCMTNCLWCSPCWFGNRSRVTPTGCEDYSRSSVSSSLRSRMEASSANYPSCSTVSAIPLKAYTQFSPVGGRDIPRHPVSQVGGTL